MCVCVLLETNQQKNGISLQNTLVDANETLDGNYSRMLRAVLNKSRK